MPIADTLSRSWRAWLARDEPRIGPWWAGYVWSAVFAIGCAVGFTVVNAALASGEEASRLSAWWIWFRANVVISVTITVAIRLLFAATALAFGFDRLRRLKQPWRSLYFALTPITGVAIGWPLGMRWALGIDVRTLFPIGQPGAIVSSVAMALLITLVFQQFFVMKTRQVQAENRATEAQLRLLQAQMEPHFLFNTLANVASLMEADTARAKAMLESFVDYLRASLSGLGHEGHTLGDEIDLVDAYLRIIKIRMDDRLDYTIDVPASLRALPLPALTLQPLVENAIVHGLEPQIAGGRVRIGAGQIGRTLVITVDDDGAGLAEPARRARAGKGGSGTALANIRDRLRQAHGAAASLRIEPARPHGVHACLTLPLLPPRRSLS